MSIGRRFGLCVGLSLASCLFTGAALARATTVSTQVADMDIRTLLLQLAETAGCDLILAEGVQGRISLKLSPAKPRESLRAVIQARGLVVREDVLPNRRPLWWVGTGDDATLAAKQVIAGQLAQEMRLPVKTQLWRLQHGVAQDVAKWLASAGSERLLGPRSRVDVDGRTNTLMVTDTTDRLAQVGHWLAALDQPAQQVLVETRLVAVSRSTAQALGARWQVIGSTWTGRVPLSAPGGEASALRYGVLDVSGHALDVELSALESRGQGDILARPSVLATEQHAGTIASGQQIPYQETTHSGATTTRFVNAELSLEALPRVTSEGQIVLDVELKHDSPGDIQATGARAIETNRLKTQVRLGSNQTLMLGGIFRTQAVRTVSQVPVLGNIPLLGYLFRRDQVREDKQELLIFVTPRLLLADGRLPDSATQQPAHEMSDAAKANSQPFSGRAHGRGQNDHRAASR